MNVSLKDQTFTVSLEEMVDIINGRKKAALMGTIMSNGKENALCVEYNEGVKMMAKYMGDYFMNEFDKVRHETIKNGGGW